MTRRSARPMFNNQLTSAFNILFNILTIYYKKSYKIENEKRTTKNAKSVVCFPENMCIIIRTRSFSAANCAYEEHWTTA